MSGNVTSRLKRLNKIMYDSKFPSMINTPRSKNLYVNKLENYLKKIK